jgi:aspartyl-tRNA(Asn)/glutamyl-tRNA(Gln) amidotransferase subunit B
MKYIPTIGLEIHIELNTKSKMFCSCKNDPDERRPNFNICPICTAQPGTLPVINKEAVRKVIKTGLALNCQIPEYSKFDRKNYFYPDLPKGYQISQYDMPFCKEGFLEIGDKKIRIRRVHLEEDTGKLIHPEGADYSLVDFNRAGIPLMELVTEPDITSAKEAKEFAEELHLNFHYLDISDADMEKGQMRVEVNLSLSDKKGKLGTKVEIKNLNSFRSVERGIDYEIQRQTELLEKGEKIIQETRGWNDIKGETFSQREKEEAHDYRYFPEPDLPPLHFTKKEIDEIQTEIPELPQQKRARFKKEYELDEKSIDIFVYNKNLGERFEKLKPYFDRIKSKEKKEKIIKLSADLLINTKAKDYNIPPDNFFQVTGAIADGIITSTRAKMILPDIVKKNASKIIKGSEQVSDIEELEKVIKEVIKNNSKVVEDYKKGKENAIQFLIGKIMVETKGRANIQIVKELLQKFLQ